MSSWLVGCVYAPKKKNLIGYHSISLLISKLRHSSSTSYNRNNKQGWWWWWWWCLWKLHWLTDSLFFRSHSFTLRVCVFVCWFSAPCPQRPTYNIHTKREERGDLTREMCILNGQLLNVCSTDHLKDLFFNYVMLNRRVEYGEPGSSAKKGAVRKKRTTTRTRWMWIWSRHCYSFPWNRMCLARVSVWLLWDFEQSLRQFLIW